MLFIYQPKDWKQCCRLLGLQMKDVAEKINMSRRNFYHAHGVNNTELTNCINFTKYIDEISYEHYNEFVLPPKVKLQEPRLFKNLYRRSWYSYRDLVRQTGISFVTIQKYMSADTYMDFQKTKLLGDRLHQNCNKSSY